MRASRSSTGWCRRNSPTTAAGLTGVLFEKVKAEYDARGRRNLVPTGEPDVHIACDDVLIAVGQENAFPWIERDIGIEFDRWDMPKVDPDHDAVDPAQRLLRRRRRLRAEEHHLGRRARPRRRDLDRQILPRRGCRRPAAARRDPGQPEDGHPRMELRQRHLERSALPGAVARHRGGARRHQGRGRARLSTKSSATSKPSAASIATSRPCSPASCASNATPASTSARWTASPLPTTAPKTSCAAG